MTRPRVAVVFGGRSSEHSISCLSAGSVIAALDPEVYDVVPIGITTEGRWVLADTSRPLALGPGGELPVVHGEREVSLTTGSPESLGPIDVVFPVMHGPWGQDGTLQGLLEMAGVRYVGAGVLASAVGTDKVFMKRLFAAADLPLLPYAVLSPRDWALEPGACVERVETLGLPAFVKPARAGSSFGISRVDALPDLGEAVAEAQRFDPKVVVEAAAVGAREVEVGVLQGFGNAPHEVSAVAEIRVTSEHAFYDFEAKYLPEENTALDVPARLSDADVAAVHDLAVRAFDALDCEGLARVDFFLFPDRPADGSAGPRLVVNEVETMPGFTALSMFPRMWAASGLDYPALCDRLVRLALARSTGLR